MKSSVIAKAIENRVRKGYSLEVSQEILAMILITRRDSQSLIDALVQYEFANDEEDALMAVTA